MHRISRTSPRARKPYFDTFTRYPVPRRTWSTVRSLPSSSLIFTCPPTKRPERIDDDQAGSARDEAVRSAIVPPLAELIASKALLQPTRELSQQSGRAMIWLMPAGPTSVGA